LHADSCVERAARASEVAAFCDLVGSRFALRSYRSLPGGTVGKRPGLKRTAAKFAADLLRLSPGSRPGSPAAGGRASDAHFGRVRIQPSAVARRGSSLPMRPSRFVPMCTASRQDSMTDGIHALMGTWPSQSAAWEPRPVGSPTVSSLGEETARSVIELPCAVLQVCVCQQLSPS
jgi:hypothetical protein